MSEKKALRCAVYTRKSSEEGLDQDFNSLEAQREACEAYVRSQAHEGWTLIPERFDDGGFSGGNMDRPALGKLMSMIRNGKIDVIVIYKIDRLTRSLTDFARLAETFDKHNVSFVSVTQQFNTTTSMGRLMLNVLLSFAQFEREITGERIRDKIAASKKKGMWMGGPIPMGYNVKDRQLVINETEAASVRRVFDLYLEEGNVPALLERLTRERIRTQLRTSAKGSSSGGRSFTRGHVYKLLSNPLYIGRIAHKGTTHPGQHPAIIDRKVWDAVQARFAENTQGQRSRRRRAILSAPLLSGLLYSEAGNQMIAMHSTKSGRRYHYYVEQITERPAVVEFSASATHEAQPFTGANRRPPIRLPAREIDTAVLTSIKETFLDPTRLIACLGSIDEREMHRAIENSRTLAQSLEREPMAAKTAGILARVIVSLQKVRIEIDMKALHAVLRVTSAEGENGDTCAIEAPLRYRKRGRQLKLALGSDDRAETKIDATLVTAIARACDWFERLSGGRARSITDLALEDGFDAGYVSHLMPLAFLAPRLVEDTIEGRQPVEWTADRLIWEQEIPHRWGDLSQPKLVP